MSRRFPQIAPQHDLTQARRRPANRTPIVVLALAHVPSLPWFELLVGAAFLMVLGGL